MPRRRTRGLTERESEIIHILWESGGATVQDIRSRLQGRPSASTVRTLLNIMADRGMIADDGRAYGRRYHARVGREEVQRSALRRLVDRLFDGSTEAVVVRLMDDGDVDAERVLELQAQVERSAQDDSGAG